MLLEKVTFKNKNKNSANPVERTLTDIDINQIKGKLNSAIDKLNSTATDESGNYENYYTKEETEDLINRQSDQLIERLSGSTVSTIIEQVSDSTVSSAIEKIAPIHYINQLNFDLDTLVNKIQNLD